MEALFSKEYQWLWTLALGLALFLPARQLIWALSVRRAESKHGPTDDEVRRRLKNRASVTAALASFVFAVLYMAQLFQDP